MDNLPTAFFVNRMKEVHSKLKLVHGKVETKCEICREDKAEAFCQQSTKFICAECIKKHQAFPDHVLRSEEILQGFSQIAHNQQMTMYCYDCNTLISTIKDHNHKFVKVERKRLNQQLQCLMKSQFSLSDAIKEMETIITEVEGQGRFVAKTIRRSCASLHAIIDNRQESLLAEAAMIIQQKVKCLSDQEKYLSTSYAYTQSVLEYASQCISSANDEVVCMSAEVQSRIDREMQEQQHLTPVEEADMGVEVSCSEDLKQLCLTKAKIIQFPVVATKWRITGDAAAEVNKMSVFRVVTALSNGRPTYKQPCVIMYSLVNAAKCTVDLIREDREYHIQYTPTVRGRHELIVTVNGQEVAGSPLPFFVSIHPTQLGKPVQVITGVNNPRYLAITSKGNIFVTELNNIAVFNKNGRKLKDLDYQDPYGVAVDSTDGCIYLTDNSSNEASIIKLSPDFGLKKAFNSNSKLQFRGVAAVGEEVMVCCYTDSVMVYSKELEFKRKIGSHGDGPGQFGGIVGVSSDILKNVYISDYIKSRIHVFSCDGIFLRSFSCDAAGVKRLNGPQGVSVYQQYVYVVNWGSNCVSVFSTKGEYVTSFGRRGGGEFMCPIGVCHSVDNDGFIYICDDQRIQVF